MTVALPEVKSPKTVVKIYYNYLREDCSITCEAWAGQYRIDQLVKAGAKIQKVEVISEHT